MAPHNLFKHVRTRVAAFTWLLAVCLVCATGQAGFADSLAHQAEIESRIVSLEMLMRSIDGITGEMLALQKEFQSTEGVGREAELRKQIVELSRKKEELEQNFNQLATDIDLEKMAGKEKADLDWNEELKDLLGPIMREACSKTPAGSAKPAWAYFHMAYTL